MFLKFLRKSAKFISLIVVAAVRLDAAGLEATLDRYEIRVTLDQPAVLEATLHNGGTAPIYLTGLRVLLSEGASGTMYNPALLQERLRKLDAGQTWDGPLIVITAAHRGPLLVKGAVVLLGGASPESQDRVASVPVSLTVDDPRRNFDGGYVREALPSCDRSLETCCDPSEANCFHAAGRCLYIAEGYDRQMLCINHDPGKVYEKITDVHVSSDALHVAYIARFQCSATDTEELCKRVVVTDNTEHPGPQVPTRLALSPDGLHYAYIGRQACETHLGEEACSGTPTPVVDGRPVKTLPSWY